MDFSSAMEFLGEDYMPPRKMARPSSLDDSAFQPEFVWTDRPLSAPCVSVNSATPECPSKVKITRNYVLSYNPRVTLTIGLQENRPVVCLRNDTKYCVLTQSEVDRLAQVTAEWYKVGLSESVQLDFNVDPITECIVQKKSNGMEIIRQAYTEAQPLDPNDFTVSRFELNSYAERKLIKFLPEIKNHVTLIANNKPAIDLMFDVLCNTYVKQYQLTLLNPLDQFTELTSFVNSFLTPYDLIKEFAQEFGDTKCSLTHYSMFTAASSQFEYIRKIVLQKI